MSSRSDTLVEVFGVAAFAFFIREVLRRIGAGIGGGVLSTVVGLALGTWLLQRRGEG